MVQMEGLRSAAKGMKEERSVWKVSGIILPCDLALLLEIAPID